MAKAKPDGVRRRLDGARKADTPAADAANVDATRGSTASARIGATASARSGSTGSGSTGSGSTGSGSTGSRSGGSRSGGADGAGRSVSSVADGRSRLSRATLQDVADRAGVSLTTASRVVSQGPRRVGQHMVQRVHQAVAELGYSANLQARAVATGQSSTIGVVVHDIADPYFSTIAAGLMDVADRRQLLVCLSSAPAGERAEREYVRMMRSQRARAVILIGSRSDDLEARNALRAELSAFDRAGGRVVCVGQDLLGTDTIMPENAAGAEALAHALVGQGHRTFAVLAGPRGLLTAQERLAGFRAGLRSWSLGVDPRSVISGALTRDGGYEAMSTVLALGGPLPDCVFAVTDVMAVGALARLRANGLAVPADIAVAGFDDITTLRDVYPPLTTVALPLKTIGEMAASLVLDDQRTGLPRVIPVPGEVVLRESTTPLPRPAGSARG